MNTIKLASAVLAFALVIAGCGNRFDPDEDVGVDVTVVPDTPVTADADVGPPPPSRCNPLSWAWGCLLPYPSNVFTESDPSATTGLKVTIPTEALPVIGSDLVFNPLALYPADGFPMGTPILAVFPTGIDPAGLTRHFDSPEKSLDPAQTTTLILRASDGQPVLHFAELDVDADPKNRQALVLRPMQALEPNTRYIVAIHGLTTPTGSPLLPPTAFLDLRNKTINADARVEALRARYDSDIFPALETAGWPRAEIQLAWDFTVGSENSDRETVDALAKDWLSGQPQGSPAVGGITVTSNVSDVIATRIDGHFESINVLDATDDVWGALLQRDASGKVEANGTRQVNFVVAIPRSVANRPAGSGQVPVLLVGHEFFGSADELAEDLIGGTLDALGAIGVATDWVGLNDEAAIKIIGDIQNRPDTGLRFVDLLHQGLANLRGLRTVVQGSLAAIPELQLDGASLYDPSNLTFYGVGLGQMLGAGYLGLDPAITKAVLIAGMGGYAMVFARARNFTVFIDVIAGQMANDLELQKVLALTLFGLDRVDSLRPPAPLAQSVLMQAAIGDSETPNLGTRIQARSLGLSLMGPAVQEVYGLPLVTGPVAGPAHVLAEYDFGLPEPLPGVEMRLPSADNGVHDLVQQHPAALEQIRKFMETGTIEHTCADACDPD